MFQPLYQRVAVVSFITDKIFGILICHHLLGKRDIRLLACGQQKLNGLALGLDEDVNLRAETASRTAESLLFLSAVFLSAPAAQA